ncbi:hypothetical protein EBZ80_04990 [bacterium]|nr:hypothetical protein [bacterium]
MLVLIAPNTKLPSRKRFILPLPPPPAPKSTPKEAFREFCLLHLQYLRFFRLPVIRQSLEKETVLIEYRELPHLEFLVRNMILKAGAGWSHTIVCGRQNYWFCVSLVDDIGANIRIIKTEHDNLDQSSYSELLASKEFWELLCGEKILIYQEDSCIFEDNLDDFLEWDYIGAPWPESQDDNTTGVGNGGFSLRTKRCMLDVIKTISIRDTVFNKSTTRYMSDRGMKVAPEDVYFSLNMIVHNIGKVAPRDIAAAFSSENSFSPGVLGGHNFWLANPDWKDYLYSRLIHRKR